jgi:hypothetical protein
MSGPSSFALPDSRAFAAFDKQMADLQRLYPAATQQPDTPQQPVLEQSPYQATQQLGFSRTGANNNQYQDLFGSQQGVGGKGGSQLDQYVPGSISRPAPLGNSSYVPTEYRSGGSGGRGTDAFGNSSGGDSNPGWSSLSDGQKASYYQANPTEAKLAGMAQNLFGYTSLGMLQNKMEPGFVQTQKDIVSTPEKFTTTAVTQAAEAAAAAAAAQVAAAQQAAAESSYSGGRGSNGSSYGGWSSSGGGEMSGSPSSMSGMSHGSMNA